MEWNGTKRNGGIELKILKRLSCNCVPFESTGPIQFYQKQIVLCMFEGYSNVKSILLLFLLRHQISSVEFRIKSCCVCLRFHVYTYCLRCQRNAIRLYVCIMLFFSSFIRSSVSFGFVLMYSRSFVYIIIQFIELRFYFNQFRQITLKYARSFNT